MLFFRLRFVNTLLVFLLGILVGFIFKERLASPDLPEDAQPRYMPEYERGQVQALREPEEPETSGEAPYEDLLRPVFGTQPQAEAEPELSVEPVKPSAQTSKPETVLLEPVQFFSAPAAYAGREVELPLQMITAKRSRGGWRLNFGFMDPDKRFNYLYVDAAADLLGAKPDLRIGYQYRVRFNCGGKLDTGNDLSSVKPTGEKADWATGLSAVEP